MRNRFYSPDIGRFISADPLGMVDGPNMYGYCGGDPVNRVDPMGTFWVFHMGGDGQLHWEWDDESEWGDARQPANAELIGLLGGEAGPSRMLQNRARKILSGMAAGTRLPIHVIREYGHFVREKAGYFGDKDTPQMLADIHAFKTVMLGGNLYVIKPGARLHPGTGLPIVDKSTLMPADFGVHFIREYDQILAGLPTKGFGGSSLMQLNMLNKHGGFSLAFEDMALAHAVKSFASTPAGWDYLTETLELNKGTIAAIAAGTTAAIVVMKKFGLHKKFMNLVKESTVFKRLKRFASEFSFKPRRLRTKIADDKWRYLYGNVAPDAHNTPRSLQNARQLGGIGLHDSPANRAYITRHLDDVVNDPNNVTRRWVKKIPGGGQVSLESRESLLSGPGGILKVESTWEILDDGTRRLATIIPFGGQ